MSNQNTIDYVFSGQASLGKANHKSLRGAFATPKWIAGSQRFDTRDNLEKFYTGIVFAESGAPKSPEDADHSLDPNVFKDDFNPDFPNIFLNYQHNSPPAHNDFGPFKYAGGGEPGTAWTPWPVSPGAAIDNPASIPTILDDLRQDLYEWAHSKVGSAPFIGPGTDLSPFDASGKHHRKPNGHTKGRSAPDRPLGWGVNSE